MLDTLDTGHWTLELDAVDRILELVTWMLRVLDAEDTRCRILEILDAGDAGCWCWRCVLLYYSVLVPLVNRYAFVGTRL